jgi:thymidine kinase
MKVGRLELYVGGMYASKSTALHRQGKRHLLAGRKVVYIKPNIDGRYGNDVVATHDGEKNKAISVHFSKNHLEDITRFPEVLEADVVCIDEIQFFPTSITKLIDKLIYSGKTVYCSGLDLDKEAVPFETTMLLMAKAEKVTKLQAVCSDCGEDSWITVATVEMQGRVNIGNNYKPVCRKCSVKYIGGFKK